MDVTHPPCCCMQPDMKTSKQTFSFYSCSPFSEMKGFKLFTVGGRKKNSPQTPSDLYITNMQGGVFAN